MSPSTPSRRIQRISAWLKTGTEADQMTRTRYWKFPRCQVEGLRTEATALFARNVDACSFVGVQNGGFLLASLQSQQKQGYPQTLNENLFGSQGNEGVTPPTIPGDLADLGIRTRFLPTPQTIPYRSRLCKPLCSMFHLSIVLFWCISSYILASMPMESLHRCASTWMPREPTQQQAPMPECLRTLLWGTTLKFV